MQQRSMIAEAESYLRTQLADGPQPVGDLVKGTTITARTLRRAGQNLGIVRSRNGENGPWIWSLPIEPEYLPLRSAEATKPEPPPPKPDKYAHLFARAPLPVPPLLAEGYIPDVDAMIAEAVAGGLHYPLKVAVKSTDGKWWLAIYRAPRAEPEEFCGTRPTPPHMNISVHEWDEALHHSRPLGLTYKNGRLWWRDQWSGPWPRKAN
jgi:hypothetical protein